MTPEINLIAIFTILIVVGCAGGAIAAYIVNKITKKK